MRAEHWYDFKDQAGDSNLLVQVVAHIAAGCSPALGAAVPQIWSNHAARQTQWWTQATPHDVLPPPAGSQVSRGGQEGVSGQVCWTTTIWRGPGWNKHG